MRKIDRDSRQEIDEWMIEALKKSGYFDDLLQHVYDDEYDKEVMPHYGMVPDWFVRWKDLVSKIKEVLNEDV